MSGLPNLPAALERLVEFHGHLCPGLVIGYRAALLAAESLDVTGAADEELVLVAENDSCSVDAFQALLSTTFGKGNLVFQDNGKQVFTLGDRAAGRAVRVAMRYDAFDGATLTREQRIERLLSLPANRLFHLNHVQIELPRPARMHETLRCERCDEGVMSTRTLTDAGQTYCLPCASDLGLTG